MIDSKNRGKPSQNKRINSKTKTNQFIDLIIRKFDFEILMAITNIDHWKNATS